MDIQWSVLQAQYKRGRKKGALRRKVRSSEMVGYLLLSLLIGVLGAFTIAMFKERQS